MATVGTLDVSLRARTSKFRKSMKQSQGTITSFAKATVVAGKRVAAFGAGLAAVAVGGLAYFARQQAKVIDATAKLADRLGTTTESISGLQFSAQLAGASAETMDKALEKMIRSVGEARDGVGEARDQFIKMGLSVDDLAKMDAADQFGLIADGIRDMATQSDKAAAAADIFGRSGVSLLNTLEQGSAAIKEQREEAERLGFAFNRLDARKVEQANDALTRMGLAFRGLVNTATIALAPLVEGFAKSITETIGAPGFRRKVADFFEEFAVGAIKVGTELAVIIDKLKSLKGFDSKLKFSFYQGIAAPFGAAYPSGISISARTGADNEAAIRARGKSLINSTRGLSLPGGGGSERDMERIGRGIARGFILGFVPKMPASDGRTPFGPPNKGLLGESTSFMPSSKFFGGDKPSFRVPDPQTALFAASSAAIVKTSLSDAITDGVFSGFDNVGDILENFGRSLTATITDAFVNAAIGDSLQGAFSGLFGRIFGTVSADSLAGQ